MNRAMRQAILVSFSAFALAGCETVKYVPTSEPFCKAVQTVCISKDDSLSEGTAQQLEANNLGRARVCKKRVACAKEGTPS